MAKVKRMDQIKSILKCYIRTNNIKHTTRILGVSKNTVKAYLDKCKCIESDLKELLKKSEEELVAIFYEQEKSSLGLIRLEYFQARFPYWVK